MSITHCIFDLDGLLLDTESIYTECLQKLCTPYGKNFSTDVKLKMMGKSSLEAARILIGRWARRGPLSVTRLSLGELNLPISEEEFLTKSNALYIEAFPSSDLLPGAARLIEHLFAHRIPIGNDAVDRCWTPSSFVQRLALVRRTSCTSWRPVVIASCSNSSIPWSARKRAKWDWPSRPRTSSSPVRRSSPTLRCPPANAWSSKMPRTACEQDWLLRWRWSSSPAFPWARTIQQWSNKPRSPWTVSWNSSRSTSVFPPMLITLNDFSPLE